MNYDLQTPLCRASDPITSFEAADGARLFRRSQEKRIVAILTTFGALGVDDIALMCDLEPHAVGKRVTKLGRDGLIELTGEYVTSRSGHRQRQWRIV